jgi:hypothetical protein
VYTNFGGFRGIQVCSFIISLDLDKPQNYKILDRTPKFHESVFSEQALRYTSVSELLIGASRIVLV